MGLEKVTFGATSVNTGAMFILFLIEKVLMPSTCRCCVGSKTGMTSVWLAGLFHGQSQFLEKGSEFPLEW